MTITGKTDMEAAGYLDLVSVAESLSLVPNKTLFELWKRMIFNICISNTDDHLRNHGFLLNKEGWELSPCFDLNPDLEKEEMALSIGTDTHKSLHNALDIAEFFRLSNQEAKDSIKEIQSVISKNWEVEADKLHINHNEKERMKPAFAQSYCFFDRKQPEKISIKKTLT